MARKVPFGMAVWGFWEVMKRGTWGRRMRKRMDWWIQTQKRR